MNKSAKQGNSLKTIANVQDASLRRRLAALERTISAPGATKRPPAAPANDNAPATAMLPLWPEAVRAVPNGVLRTALFGAIAKGKRRYLDDEELAAVDGVSVRYTGQRLDQGDLDVWESILHLVRTQALGKECRVTSYSLLRLMGKTDTGKNRAVLAKRITRLRASAVVLKTAKYTYIGGLVDEGRKDEKTQEWRIKINPNLAALFGRDQYTQLDWTIRKALEGKPLAQWLHGFYSSHANPFPVRADTLLRLAGSEDAAARSSHQTLRKALKDIATAAAASGQVFRFEIVKGLVHVEKGGGK